MSFSFTPRAQAVSDLIGRYWSIFGAAWRSRQELAGPERASYEIAFLPANLELIESPVHPAPRWAMLSLVVLGFLVICIALFGRLDIVATAKGKLLPDARVKVVQPAVTGIVRRITVIDGQRVVAGQVLMELDPTQAGADVDKASQAKHDMALAMARAHALLDAQRINAPPKIEPINGIPEDQREQTQQFADGLYREYQDKLASAQAELAKRQADLASTEAEISKYQATIPLARQQANDYKELAKENYVAQHDYLAKEQSALELEHELVAQQSHAHELLAAIAQQRAELASTTSQFRREQMDTLDKSSQQFSQQKNEETKAETRKEMMTLTAPVSGTVQQLAVHTLGGVVTTAQALMTIVPDDLVEVEATVENKDVGFVNVGQSAIVKVESFPYTEYGYLRGTVESLSNDAVQDKKLGLAFVARIRLVDNKIRVNDKWIPLTPGMEVTAEINTGSRSVLRYFLDPLVRTGQESLRER